MISAADAELLATLDRAFAHHAGGDARIDVGELRRALGIQSEYLARRVLTCLDVNRDGLISREEFLGAVRTLLFASDREKLHFAFRVHDHDGDGFIDREELTRMIAISLAESDVADLAMHRQDRLAAAVLAHADTDRNGRVSFDELEAEVRRRPHLLAQMTRSEAIWLAPNEELILLFDERRRRSPGRLRRFLENRGLEAAWLAFFAVLNVAVFASAMLLGRAAETADLAMRIGSAVGACVMLDGALVFLPMMRRIVGRLRASAIGHVLPVDTSVTFHQIVGHTLFALAVIHAGAITVAWVRGHAGGGEIHGIVLTGHGATGSALLVVFGVMWLLAFGFVRRSRWFEVFHTSHMLYVVWIALAIAHAPRFALLAGPVLLPFLVEQIVRRLRRAPVSRILSVAALRSGVTRLEIERPRGFTFEPGAYAFLCLPWIAKHEWHPFTISSAPERSTLTFHVRSLGNWTRALRRHAEEGPREGGPRAGPLVARIDGPYGTPSSGVFDAPVAVLIGAGIGVTPFASVLESIVLRGGTSAPAPVPSRVHFFWLNRDRYSFEWFHALLARLEEVDQGRLLDVHLYMTGGHTGVTALGLELARDVTHAYERSDLVTGLRTKTHMGHPDWDLVLAGIKSAHPGKPVDVFFCGPRGLEGKLGRICERLGMTFHEERF